MTQHTEETVEFGEMLSHKRQARSLDAVSVTALSGIGAASISRWEHGQGLEQLIKLHHLLRLYHTKVTLGGKEITVKRSETT